MPHPEKRLKFDRPPSTGPRYLAIAMSRKPSRLADGLTIPEMEAVQAPRPIDGMHLRDYRRVCGLEETDAVPLVYPHVLAAPAQLALLSHPDFPLRLLGLVHLKNEIVQYRLIAPGDQLGLRISVGGHRDTEKGQEFDIVTRVTRGEELVWLETSTALARAPRKADAAEPSAEEGQVFPSMAQSLSWQAPEDAGRAYAGVSGDYNPIHLSRMTARWFGFRQPIAHGMWTLARCLGELGMAHPQERCTVTVGFGKPLYLPGWVVLGCERARGAVRFRLSDSAGSRVFMNGAIEKF
jgi:acyl dehydratase